MNIRINGEHREFANSMSITELIEMLGFAGKRIAIERNGEIVPKSLHASTRVNEGDSFEIVVAVGGG